MISLADWNMRLDTHHDDWACRLAFSDWLEECGWPIQANGQRWQARERKYPFQTKAATKAVVLTWDWWKNESIRPGVPTHASLDALIFDAMIWNVRVPYFEYRSRHVAESALAEALWCLGIFVTPDQLVQA